MKRRDFLGLLGAGAGALALPYVPKRIYSFAAPAPQGAWVLHVPGDVDVALLLAQFALETGFCRLPRDIHRVVTSVTCLRAWQTDFEVKLIEPSGAVRLSEKFRGQLGDHLRAT